ncbi:MAG: folylpolyglutamate synthase/dihydrofolate synthase family protein [Alphaproteobacteria bacterium]
MATTDEVLKRFAKLHPKVIDISLIRILKLLEKLGCPQNKLPPVVHVAGTNGKGSTIAFLRYILEASGLKVHTYTSPHLVRFNERIRLAGKLIAEDKLLNILEDVEKVNKDEPITLFEITTAVAMKAFAAEEADVLLLETGLGGRFDATNVIVNPIVSILTPISMDHENFLGDSLEKIAGEKIPIIKPRSRAVVGKQKSIVNELILEHCKDVDSPVFRCGYEWRYEIEDEGFIFFSKDRKSVFPKPNLEGDHQIHNASVAIAALEVMGKVDRKFKIDDQIIANAISKTAWPARLQLIKQGRLKEGLSERTNLWLDGGHNPGAGEVLSEFWQGKDVYVIMAMLRTKDATGFLSSIIEFAKKIFVTEIPDNENSFSSLELVEKTKSLGFNNVFSCADIKEALACCHKEKEPQHILICGSLYLSGKALEENGTFPE